MCFINLMEYDVAAGARFSISARSRLEQAPLLPSVKPPHAVSRSRLFLSSMADAEAAEMTAVRGQSPGGGPPLLDYRRLTRLYCRNGGHHLQIPPDGTVRGERDERDAHSKTAGRSMTQSLPQVCRADWIRRGLNAARGTNPRTAKCGSLFLSFWGTKKFITK